MEKLRTLVVDDELGMCLGIKKALRNYTMMLPGMEDEFGFDVDMAESAETALEKITENRPDILLLDYKLPSMSGLELLEKITVKDAEMVTIMITAFASLETAVTAVKRGAFDFLAKPFEPAELRATIKKAAESLLYARQLRKLALEKHQVRFQFISVLGHELKSPLNAVEGYLNLMDSRVGGDRVDDYQEMIARSLIRIQGMRKLILDLLDLTRIESGQKKREMQKVVLQDIVRKSMETVLPDARKRAITLDLQAAEPIEFYCDPSEVEIVMNNLISNAVKYNRDSGRVDINLGRRDGEISIAVKDTGVGLSKEETARLFQEFVRIKNSKTRNILGSGLGLSIVKKIVQLYDGTVDVKSAENVGSEFTVYLKNAA